MLTSAVPFHPRSYVLGMFAKPGPLFWIAAPLDDIQIISYFMDKLQRCPSTR